MPDYKSMYFRLFNRVSDAILILQAAQQEAENTFIESQNEAPLQLIEKSEDDSCNI